MSDILFGILGASGMIGVVVTLAIDEAKMNLCVKKKKESDWWTNKTVIGKSIIVICVILGIVGIIMRYLIESCFKFWEKYCVKQGK